jgi:hypothetical protein
VKPRFVFAALLLVSNCLTNAAGSDQKSASQNSTNKNSANQAALPHLSKETRVDLIRGFDAELVYIRTSFPMGQKGLSIKNGIVSPNGDDLQRMLVLTGPALKPGDEARITAVVIKDDRIHFELNGGPVKKKKWYEHVQVAVGSGAAQAPQTDQTPNPRGTYVDLVFDRYVPDLTPEKFKELLRPALDFDAKSAVEAYLDTVPPKVKQAIENHQVLVGMNREMLIYSKGRPPRKIREKDGETEYEEWIYGEPPQDVDFVRMLGDEVVRVETMKVDGSKTLRTAKEVDLEPGPSVAKAAEEAKPANVPTLRRPGETPAGQPDPTGTTKPVNIPPDVAGKPKFDLVPLS